MKKHYWIMLVALIARSVMAVTDLTQDQSVKFIGLWTNNPATGNQRQDWAMVNQNETVTSNEWAVAMAVTDSPERRVARNAIIAKAQTWANRIDSEFNAGRRQWVSDNIPEGSMVAIQYYHPKFCPDTEPEWETSEWGGGRQNEWLRVTVRGRSLHPDNRWGNIQGTSYGNKKITIAKGMTPERTQRVIAHEVGHSTKDFFERDFFGSGDHSPSVGLMDPTSSQNDFSPNEQKILRGEKVTP